MTLHPIQTAFPRLASAVARRAGGRLRFSTWRHWLGNASTASPVPGLTSASASSATVFHDHTCRFTHAQTLVRVFYAFLLYYAFAQFSELAMLSQRPAGAPLWPVTWLTWQLARGFGLPVLLTFFLVTNIGGIFVAASRAGRIATFLGLLEYVALKNSYGKIGHSLHLLVLTAGLFILLPDGWARPAPATTRRLRQTTLLVFWLAQAAVLMSYTMSGIGKLGGAIYQAACLQPNAFTPGSLGAHIAQRLIQTRSQSYFGAWIIHHPFLTWPAMPAAIYLETFALAVAFRPSLGRVWAGLLILFHAGTYFTMTISFPQSCFLLAMFFFPSPFEPANFRWRAVLRDVPLLRFPYKLWQTTGRGINEVTR